MSQSQTQKLPIAGARYPWGASIPQDYEGYLMIYDQAGKECRSQSNSFQAGPIQAPRFPVLYADTKGHLMELINIVNSEARNCTIVEWNMLFSTRCPWLKG